MQHYIFKQCRGRLIRVLIIPFLSIYFLNLYRSLFILLYKRKHSPINLCTKWKFSNSSILPKLSYFFRFSIHYSNVRIYWIYNWINECMSVWHQFDIIKYIEYMKYSISPVPYFCRYYRCRNTNLFCCFLPQWSFFDT